MNFKLFCYDTMLTDHWPVYCRYITVLNKIVNAPFTKLNAVAIKLKSNVPFYIRAV